MQNNPNKNIDVSDLELILQGLNHLDQGVSLFDSDHKLRLFNDQYETILGFPGGFVKTGISFEELVRYQIENNPYQKGDPEKTLQSRLDQVQGPGRHQLTRKQPDGRILKITSTPLPDGGFITTYEDVTVAENAKRQVEEREEEFRTYLELSPVGALLVEMDGTIRFHNSRILEIFDYNAEEFSQIKTSELYFNQHDREEFLTTLQERRTPSNFRFLGKKSDGSSFPLLLTSSLITLKGKQRIFTWVNDLSDIEAAEKTIRQLNKQQQLILSAAGTGIIGVDETYNIQSVNPAAAELLGYGDIELTGMNLDKLFAKPETMHRLSLAQTIKGETEMVQKGGKRLPVRYTSTKLGQTAGKVIVFDDISERVAAEQVLHQAMEDIEASSQAKSHFLSTMSHELRTPLNAILGFAQILNANQSGNMNEQQLNFIDHIFSAGEHLLKLINEAIDIAAVESGQVSLSLQSIGCNDIINASLKQMEDMAEKKSVTLKNSNPPSSQQALIADYARLQQILMHLISNAIKYNKEHGRVEISVENSENGFVRLVIKDSGRGMPEDLKEDIFAPFNRLTAQSDGIEGTGLGLTLSKNLTQLMGGDIGFTSSSGGGSTFWVEFPTAKDGTPLLLNKTTSLQETRK